MASPATDALFLIKDVKPGSKNLNIVFIVLEIGKLATWLRDPANFAAAQRLCVS